MSTPTSTTPTVRVSAPQPPAPRPSGPRTALVAVGAAVVGAAVVAGLVLALTGSGTPAAAQPAVRSASHTVTIVSTPTGGGSAHHVVPTPPVPSPAVETLQVELGRLNYYEGPVTGLMNTQTEQAVTYLQRDAHLPQTGTMNAATDTALIHFLADGNNQMGGTAMAS